MALFLSNLAPTFLGSLERQGASLVRYDGLESTGIVDSWITAQELITRPATIKNKIWLACAIELQTSHLEHARLRGRALLPVRGPPESLFQVTPFAADRFGPPGPKDGLKERLVYRVGI
jgi:hypothetical protein